MSGTYTRPADNARVVIRCVGIEFYAVALVGGPSSTMTSGQVRDLIARQGLVKDEGN